MSYPNDYVMQKISITPQERDKAKKKAKSEGMTFQGWLAKLIRDELKESPKEASGWRYRPIRTSTN